MGRKLKFPEPKDYVPAEPAVLCPAERVIGLYNQGSNGTARRIAKKVRTWFAAEAHRKGWAGVYFLPEVQSNHGAGCVLWRRPEQINVTIQVTEDMLILSEEEEFHKNGG
jgi:hypothetical protein